MVTMQPVRARALSVIGDLLAARSTTVLRVAMGAVFLGFGALKFVPGLSPAQDLAVTTTRILTFGLVPDPVALVGVALLEQFDETYNTNVYATFWLSKAAIAQMPPGATIINSTSVEAYTPAPILVDYASTKAAINTFIKALAQQVAPKGIRVNAVAPGPIWTPLQVVGGQPEEALSEFGAQTALGRAGQPAELAPAYVLLASPESSFVIGETLAVTGGMPTP